MKKVYHGTLTSYNRRVAAAPAVAALALLFACGAAAQAPPDPDRFCAGLWADDLRLFDCVRGPAGSGFDLFLWLWVPSGPGLNYVTVRLGFPGNLELSGRPDLHPLATDLIVVRFIDGTVEWTIFFDQCPVGWIEVFSQECILLDAAQSEVRIVEAVSLARHCDFAIEGLLVIDLFRVNDPACAFVGVRPSSWGAIKTLCR